MKNNKKWSTDYSYDAADRLTAAAERGEETEHYAYDAAGNIIYRGGDAPAHGQAATPPTSSAASTPIAAPASMPPLAPPAPMSAPAAQGGWTCPVCGLANTSKFCKNDGTPRPSGNRPTPAPQGGGARCPNCGGAVSPGAKFCKACGARM